MSLSTMGRSALPEYEDELEGEEFDLGGIVSGLLGEGEGEFEDEYELEDEFEYEGEFEDEYEYELEDEWEDEFEGESERMANPLRRVYPDAMMEHLGHAAAEAETEAEAEAFVGALVPLAARKAHVAAPIVARSTPHLVRGLSTVAHTLRRNPTTRHLVRALPTIASRTTHTLARRAAHGRPITPRQAARALAHQTRAVLGNPRARNHIVRRARAVDRRYHRAARGGQRPTQVIPGRSATAVQYGVPVRYGVPARGGAVVRYGAPARGTRARPVHERGHPRRRRYPPGLSIAWVPVPAWRGSQPPPGAYRY
jgi:hypothetical protein